METIKLVSFEIRKSYDKRAELVALDSRGDEYRFTYVDSEAGGRYAPLDIICTSGEQTDATSNARECQCVCHRVGLLGFMCCPCSEKELRDLVTFGKWRSEQLPAIPIGVEAEPGRRAT